MIRFQQQRTPVFDVAIPVSLAAVFVIDLLTPLGVAEWVFYLIPVILGLYTWRPRLPLYTAAASTVLVLAGLFVSLKAPSDVPDWLPRVNRSLVILAIWVVAFVAHRSIRTKLELRERDWIRTGQRDLSMAMQGEPTPRQLGERVLRFLCEYLEAPVGTLYAVEADGSARRLAAHALGDDAGAPAVLAPGEGLLGQAIKDGHLAQVSGVPAGHLQVASTLGRTPSAHLVVVPTQVDGRVSGAVELGLLHPVGRADLDLLDAVAEPIAIALRSAYLRARQAELLEETQRQAEELQAQQEELRVTNEELEAQARALGESQQMLQAQQAALERTNAQLEDQAQRLEQQRDELSHAQIELIERADELTRANQYKSEFLANMSHELRTPLNSALILAKLLADDKDGNLTPEQVRYASTIYSAGNDLLVLINDILDLSRIEAGRLELHVELVELPRMLESLQRTFRPMAEQKGLALTVELAPDAPAALATDGLRVQQVLRNLLSNALKFTEAGAVSLMVSADGAARVAFSVRDSGIGIPLDQQEVVFEAFRQANGTTNRKYGGTGLGLTISRELAHRLGGDITVESAPGRGSTFTLTIARTLEVPTEPAEQAPSPGRDLAPRAHAEAAAPASVGPRATRAPSPASPIEDDRQRLGPGARSILIVEDDPAFARVLSDLAHEQRFQALVASTAAAGLALAGEHLPSAVLLDVHLPDGSGLSVLEQLKRNPATRHIPVHVVSVADHTRQALELGAVGYMLKPVEREQLVAAVQKLAERLDRKVRQVLIVEDAPVQRESLVRLLETERVAVVAVATATEALERLRESTFDCMVLDLALPDMSGYDLLDRMAAGEAFSFPPVVVYTGRALSRDDEDRLRRYASSVIVKGARSPERLLDEVTLFLHQVEGSLPPAQQRMLREARHREAALEGRQILVVDDDARNVFALASILEGKGARPRLARNGKEALAALETAAAPGAAAIDLVLMDVMMPEMDGLTAIREIRKREALRHLPIIALTAKAMPKDREECLAAGADDYVAKPLEVDKLISLIKIWLPR